MDTSRKDTQRERLLLGMARVASQEGYGKTTVAKVIAEAGVSRPTFYDYFANREDCFLAALADIQEQALRQIRQAVEHEPPHRVASRTIEEIVRFADSHPESARVLMVQSLTGARALDARDRTLEAIAQPIEAAIARLPADEPAADLSARVMLGAVERLLSARLKREKPLPPRLFEEIMAWLDAYRRPVGEHQWRAMHQVGPLAPSPAETRLAEPPPLPPGRPRLSKADVEANHRKRVLIAAAQASMDQGFPAVTTAEITARAGVDARVVHRLFNGKQDLLASLFELSFQHVMGVTAGAFFVPKDWYDRVWEAGRAFVQCIEQNQILAHIVFIETYAGEPDTVRRAEGLLDAFTLFLRGDEAPTTHPQPTSRLTLDAITAAVFEIVYREVRAGSTHQLAGLLPHVTHLTLAPLVGSTPINRFIERKLSAEGVLARSGD
jgi:AcrR family transcriptional regulator